MREAGERWQTREGETTGWTHSGEYYRHLRKWRMKGLEKSKQGKILWMEPQVGLAYVPVTC